MIPDRYLIVVLLCIQSDKLWYAERVIFHNLFDFLWAALKKAVNIFELTTGFSDLHPLQLGLYSLYIWCTQVVRKLRNNRPAPVQRVGYRFSQCVVVQGRGETLQVSARKV